MKRLGFIGLAAAVLIGVAAYGTTQAKSRFLIEVASHDGEIILKCRGGCDWEELSWACAEDTSCSVTVDSGGMVDN